jgi:3-hydroxyisobutyrate dehydrogenase
MKPETDQRIGYIGLGDMGAAMVQRLCTQGWKPVVYVRRAATLQTVAGFSLESVESPRAVGERVDILCLCVVDTPQIEEVLFGENGAAQAMRPGSVVIVHSTISPDDCKALAQRLAERDIHFIDAPVTGAAERARNGELTIIVGGDASIVARCMPLLESTGSFIPHLGDVGSGQVGKLLNNGLFIIQTSLVDELARLTGVMGLDRDMVLRIIDSGTAGSWASGYYRQALAERGAIFTGDTSYEGGVMGIVRKDIDLFLKQLRAAGCEEWRIARLAAGAVDSITAP